MNGSRVMAKIAGIEFERENDIRDIQDDKHQKQRGGHELAGRQPREIALAMIFVCDRDQLARVSDDAALLQVDRFIAREHRFEARIDQEKAENDDRPVESLDQGVAGEDENAAQDECADDAPQQHPHLQMSGDLKVCENDNEYEDVVHAQRVFDEVARQKLDGSFLPKLPIDPGVETERDKDVAGRGPQRLADRNFPRLAVKDAEVGGEDGKDEGGEGNPG